jgi:hypothetical protein
MGILNDIAFISKLSDECRDCANILHADIIRNLYLLEKIVIINDYEIVNHQMIICVTPKYNNDVKVSVMFEFDTTTKSVDCDFERITKVISEL